MPLVQFLLRAICQHGRYRLRLVMLPIGALAAALGAAVSITSAVGGHPLHTVLAAGMHLLVDSGTLATGGGPPNP